MASKGPRSKLDHETRAKRQKALEASRELRRPKTHWDHVLDEMIWLSKDFEAERKWKLALAKKVALRASKGMVDQATRGEKRIKEEEQRMRKVALNISKDVKKFWTKIEKLVLYKHQLELDDKKKKALDKQLEYLLGQTERYSTMLAENLLGTSNASGSAQPCVHEKTSHTQQNESNENTNDGSTDLIACKSDTEINTDVVEADDDYNVQSEDDLEDDEQTIAEDEALISIEEREEELATLQNEANVPLDELLKRYSTSEDARSDREVESDAVEADDDYSIHSEDDLEDDEQTIEEDEAFISKEERQEELDALKSEVDIPLDELLKRYSMNEAKEESSPEACDISGGSYEEVNPRQINEESSEGCGAALKSLEPIDPIDSTVAPDADGGCSEIISCHREKSNGPSKMVDSRDEKCNTKLDGASDTNIVNLGYDFNDDQGDDEFVIGTGEEEDDETTLKEEEELAKRDAGDPEDEIALLQKESEIPLEQLLARYNMDSICSGSADDESDYSSAHSDQESLSAERVVEDGDQGIVRAENEDSPELRTTSPSHREGSEESGERDARIADATAAARSAQPTGNTFSTTNVRTKFPFLIKYPLREYQHIGLDWLVTMYEKRLNGILADEMGLGKTIMTIALLAHLACEKGIWGPHLIVVPTSVMLNWETEFLKWCPAFKILTYFGSAKERKYKRQGWMKPNSFHVCITTYRLVIQDSKIFKRKKWRYLILDEAHLIKNWKSQRWQTLLNFNSKRRILLTGTPLQNDLMELWSLMHFLMPHIFQSHQEFKDWFCNPISGMVEGQEKVNKEVVDRLHNVLRPFILRRLKRDVEKQLPMKQEHVIYCRLSKRQRNLYEDFIANSETQATLANGNFIGMLNVIMQLRKVCNHPDLFEGRPIISSFDMEGIEMQLSSNVCSLLSDNPFSSVNLSGFGFLFTHLDFSMASWESDEIQSIATPSKLIEYRPSPNIPELTRPGFRRGKPYFGTSIFEEIQKAIFEERLNEAKKRAADIAWWNTLRCRKKPVFSTSLRQLLTMKSPVDDIQSHKSNPVSCDYSSKLSGLILSPVELFERMRDQVECFMFAIPAARAPAPVCWSSKSGVSAFIDPVYKEKCSEMVLPLLAPIRPAIVRRQLYFPDRRLIQFDCGKLQRLAVLLRRLRYEGHRALIFTQMTKMLDILEAFINLYGYTYVRLDGSTQPEERQTLMQRFNTNPKIFLFILSTRSGGVGINLVGADTVIFYDSDWNPAMDQQAQDRCHRIGQTREVHIYRLISESTIEENILKKANQKRALDNLVIQSGGYNTEFFKKLDPMELFSGHGIAPVKEKQQEKNSDDGVEVEVPMSSADLEAALRNAEDEADYMALKRVEEEEAVDNQEFTEEAIGRMEDDDVANEDAPKVDEFKDQNALVVKTSNKVESNLDGDKGVTIADNEDDIDTLADVKQMAAAAAASGQAALSFENQLRPIDRYAIRFLEIWDPIISKGAIEYEARFDEREWELERIEKLKEDMEAEIDDDDELLVYEKWDAEFATQAYHQHVEALAHQEMMEEMERKAKEKELSEDVNGDSVNRNEASGSNRSKSKKKKQKKAKVKPLKKESLPYTTEAFDEEEELEDMLSDCEDSFQVESPCRDVMLQRKRKKDQTTPIDEEKTVTKTKSKKTKKTALVTPMSASDSNLLGIPDEPKVLRPNDDGGADLELKPTCRVRTGGKIVITTIPMKRVYTIKPEKLKKKGSMWSSDCFPSPDSWSPQEDAVLCALLHEYGPNWSLASDTLYGMTAGGHYRGRFRHPILCCERVRELAQKSVHSATDLINSEKGSAIGPAKGLLKLTEDHFRALLDAVMEQPDTELLLQRHFAALLTSVWKVRSRVDRERVNSVPKNNCYPSIRLFGTSVNPKSERLLKGPSERSFNLHQCSKLITTALHDVESMGQDNSASRSNQMEEDPPSIEKLDVMLEFVKVGGETEECSSSFPSIVPLTIPGLDPVSPPKVPSEEGRLRPSQHMAESRFRAFSSAGLHDVHGWVSSAFRISDSKSRPFSKSSTLGKHKLGMGETSRPSKSKARKVVADPTEISPFVDSLFLPLTAIPNDRSSTSAYLPGVLDGPFEDILLDTPHGMEEEEHLSQPNGLEMVHHSYDPSFISGLDNCFSLPEYTDAG